MESSNKVIKIAIVGPESTGKSTLSAKLAAHYNTVWVPEYARSYCEKLTDPCTWEDEINMFYGQLELEKKFEPLANRLLICDTTFLTVKIWSDHMFGRTPPEVLEALPRHSYDFYLLLDIDTPWEDDPLREFPNLRVHFMNVWHTELQGLNTEYQVISGLGEARLSNAILAIDNFLSHRISLINH